MSEEIINLDSSPGQAGVSLSFLSGGGARVSQPELFYRSWSLVDF